MGNQTIKGRVVRSGVLLVVLAPALFLFSTSLMAGVRQEWVEVYNSAGNGIDRAADIAVGHAGGVYVTGPTHCTVVGTGPCINTGFDYTTVAYDRAGTLLWQTRYDGPVSGDDVPRAMAVAPDGKVYVTGYSEGFLTGKDYATAAFDASGSILWVARYDGPEKGDDEARALAVGPSGTVYVTGSSLGTGTGLDFATVAYDPEGNELWVARYNGPANGDDEAAGIALTSSGTIVVTGSSQAAAGGFDYATVGYDSSGRELWTERYDGHAHKDDRASAVATGSKGAGGALYVTGSIDDDTVTSGYGTVAYGASGGERWAAVYSGGAAGPNRPFATGVGRSGSVYVTGRGFDPGTGADFATVAYTKAGRERWVRTYTGFPPFDYQAACDLAVDRSENVYVTGESRGASTSEYATVAYDHNGKALWEAVFAMPAGGYAIPAAIALDRAGDAYVTGECKSEAGSSDFCTVKYSRAGEEDEDEDADEAGDGQTG
jgi:hypothetical protein